MIQNLWDFTVKTDSLVWKRLRKCTLGWLEGLEGPVGITGWAWEGGGENLDELERGAWHAARLQGFTALWWNGLRGCT